MYYSRAIWIDASIRFISTANMSHIKSQLLQTGGVLQMVRSTHSMFAATHHKLYSYLPWDVNKVKQTGDYLVFRG